MRYFEVILITTALGACTIEDAPGGDVPTPAASGITRRVQDPTARDLRGLCTTDDPDRPMAAELPAPDLRVAQRRVDDSVDEAAKAWAAEREARRTPPVVAPPVVPAVAPAVIDAQQAFLRRSAELEGQLDGEALAEERARLKATLLE